MTTTKTAIGQLKSKVTKHCTTCGCSTKRNLTADVYENTPTEIERAKQEIKEKASKEYTCRICKSIERDLSKQGFYTTAQLIEQVSKVIDIFTMSDLVNKI